MELSMPCFKSELNELQGDFSSQSWMQSENRNDRLGMEDGYLGCSDEKAKHDPKFSF